MGKQGVQYVSGVPPQTPVLRPLRRSIYDREQVWGCVTRNSFFQDSRKTADGRGKDESFTSMTQCGQLGYPLEYDLAFISISPVSADPDYVEHYERFIWSSSVWTWIFGSAVPWFKEVVSKMHVRGPINSYAHDQSTGRPYKITVKDGKPEAVPLDVHPKLPPAHPPFDAPAGLAGRLLTRFWNVTTPDRKARRINSTESFRGEILPKCDDPKAKEIDAFMAMEGILYAQL